MWKDTLLGLLYYRGRRNARLIGRVLLFASFSFCMPGQAQPPTVDGFDAKAIIKVKTVDDAQKMRTALVRFIWKTPSLPTAMPDAIESSISPSIHFESDHVAAVRRLTRTMEFGLQSHLYLYEV